LIFNKIDLFVLDGFELDRLWAVTTSEYKVITARSHPKLVMVKQSLMTLNEKTLVKLEADSISRPLILDPLSKEIGKSVEFYVWDDKVHGFDFGDGAASWFSEFLGEAGYRLLIKGPQPRIISDLYLKREGFENLKPETGFADGFPILITSKESLQELQKNLPEDAKSEIGMLNFRPNLVLQGFPKPYEEDNLGVIRIGGVKMHCDKPCSRCSFPNVNPETGVPHKTEPSKTLMKTRRCFPHIGKYQYFFGINCIPLQQGKVYSLSKVFPTLISA